MFYFFASTAGLTKFSLGELEAATDGFAARNIIGRGGSSGSTVFKVLHMEVVLSSLGTCTSFATTKLLDFNSLKT